MATAIDPFANTSYEPKPEGAVAPKSDDTPLIGKEGGARLLQAATFGFGADAAEAVSPGTGKKIRGLADQYQQGHPLASLGMDVATGAAWAAVAPETALARLPGLVRAGVAGAGIGALQGAGSGGSISQRADAAKQGAMVGGVMGPIAHGVVSGVAPLIGRGMEAAGITSADSKAAGAVGQAMAKDKGAQAALAADPSQRLVDVSPRARDLVRRATTTGSDARRGAQDLANADSNAQPGRMMAASADADQPFLAQKQQLSKNLDQLKAEKNVAYERLQTQVSTPDADFAKLAGLPTMQRIGREEYAKWRENVQQGSIKAPVISPDQAAKGAVPMTLLDQIQRRLGQDSTGAMKTGDTMEGVRLGNLQKDMLSLMKKQSYDFKSAFGISAEAGSIERAGEQGAKWGAQFSKGLNQADIDTFHAMSPYEQAHARIGFVNGVEDFLRNPRPMSEASLKTAENAMSDPTIREMVGVPYASAMRKRFATEAARARNSRDFASPVVNREEFEAGHDSNMANYVANKTTGSAIGSVINLARNVGFSEDQARKIIDIAAKPNGLEELRKAGISEKLLKNLRRRTSAGIGAQAAAGPSLAGVGKSPSNVGANVSVGPATVTGTLPQGNGQ